MSIKAFKFNIYDSDFIKVTELNSLKFHLEWDIIPQRLTTKYQYQVPSV